MKAVASSKFEVRSSNTFRYRASDACLIHRPDGNVQDPRRPYDLVERTKSFAISIRQTVRRINDDVLIKDDVRQLLRSSGSVGANYIEAMESSTPKEKAYRISLCRKEAKECVFWLDLIIPFVHEPRHLLQLRDEAFQLQHIFGAFHRRIAR